ncbi:MAG: FAD binding domain-containing protein [Fusobacteriaceae bacterium]
MFNFTKYFAAPTLESAYDELIKNKRNIILGGTSFLRMENTQYNTAIDLMNLSLSYIREEREFFHVGAMTTFRELEIDKNLKSFFGDYFEKSVKNILGVQFRNNVRVGATVFSKYGFSDLIPALLALDTTLVLHHGGEISLENFLEEKSKRRDILVEIKIRKNIQKLSFQTIRKNSADYAILNLTLSLSNEGKYKIVLGATPKCAKIAWRTSEEITKKDLSDESIFQLLDSEIVFEDNMRASGEYRKKIARAMLKRALDEVKNSVIRNDN